MPINLINWTNISDFSGIMQVPNTAVGGFFYSTILFIIFIILVMLFISTGLETALLVSASIILLPSVFLAYANLVDWWVTGSFIGVIIFIVMYMYWGSKQ
jgi:hypothetical protein